jgi:predicted nucleic acid-binding protein
VAGWLLDLEVGETNAQLRLTLEQRGLPRADNDLWIAATAFYHEFRPVTDDGHFAAVPGLRVVNWLR